MADVILGLVAIIAGAAMLLEGQLVLRLVLPIWGFFAGFAAGAGLVADLGNDRFLGTVLGWVIGLAFGLVLALLAYFVYAVAVILAMASFGFAIGSGFVVAIGIHWNWVAVLVGLAVGAVLGIASIVANMPMLVLVVLGSVAGAIGVVGGLMLVFGSLNTADFSHRDFVDTVNNSWFWYVLLLLLIIFGVAAQLRRRIVRQRSIHDYWYAEAR